MKTVVILLALFTFACGSNSVVGKWRSTRTYDFGSQTWTEVRQEVLVELFSNGKFQVILPGEQRVGEYELDESVNPHRFIAADRAKIAIRGIYKVAGDKLTVRGGESPVHLEYLQSFDPSEDKATFPMVEFVREKE